MTDPTPATPDEAVAPMVDLLRAEFDQGHMMVMEPIAERVLALSRQQALPLPSERGGQGDTVAARAEDVARRYAARNWDAMSPVMQEHFLDVARRLLVIGADGAGDGR